MIGKNTNKIALICRSVFPSTMASAMIVSQIASSFTKDELLMIGQKPYWKSKEKWNVGLPEIKHVGFSSGWIPRGRRWFAWIQWLQFPFIYYKSLLILKKFEPSSIVAVFPNEYYLFLAYIIAKKLKIPFYPWFHNTYVENRKGTYKLFAKWLQPRIFNLAQTIFVMSDGLKEFYESTYPNSKFHTLRHGFDIPMKKEYRYETSKSEISMAFAGTLNESCYDATKRFFRIINKRCKDDIRINLFTQTPESVWRKKGIWNENLILHGQVPIKSLGDKLSKNDFVLIMHGFQGGLSDIEYKTIFPTRVVPLLYSGKPLIAHCPLSSNLGQFLLNHNCALVITSTDEKVIKNDIEIFISDKDRQKLVVKNALKIVEIFNKNSIKEELIEVLNL